ncbi:MAG TPA: tetratricopeptide repeat protein [Usitatibacter sp.]|nr:tetratricopeptide repeat protein [Usitatibacter sp.]
MRTILALIAVTFLAAGCATAPSQGTTSGLLADAYFAQPAQPIRATDVFAINDEMRRYLAREVGPKLNEKGRARGLYEALYSRSLLKIDYDAAMTRNAVQTFEARTGNCLSLAIMTAALAKELGLKVNYQSVVAEDLWTRAGGIYFTSRHVNVTLGRRHTDPRYHFEERNLLTIDFMPVGELQRQIASPITEKTVVAMYLNNRAAELLAEGRVDESYWWARESALQDPSFTSAFNTLGVIYRRHGHLAEAEKVLRHVLAREPANTHAMANLALVYGDQGRAAEADALSRKLASIQPHAPFHFFERGIAAMKRGDHATARDFFQREVERDPTYHEFQFWLAAAYAGLGDMNRARRHLRAAIEASPAREQDLYAAKLARINASPEPYR